MPRPPPPRHPLFNPTGAYTPAATSGVIGPVSVCPLFPCRVHRFEPLPVISIPLPHPLQIGTYPAPSGLSARSHPAGAYAQLSYRRRACKCSRCCNFHSIEPRWGHTPVPPCFFTPGHSSLLTLQRDPEPPMEAGSNDLKLTSHNRKIAPHQAHLAPNSNLTSPACVH